MHKIYVLGMGPGSLEYVLPITQKIIKECDVLIGGKRNLSYFEELGKEHVYIGNNLSQVLEYTKENYKSKKIAYLLSGDTGFYSMLDFLKKHFSSQSLQVIPGISSYQYLMAKIGQTWQDAFIGSLHGRECDFIKAVKAYKKVILLTDQKHSPSFIAKRLMEDGIKEKVMFVGENLSYDHEKITKGSLEEIEKIKKFHMSVVVIIDEMEL